VNHANEYARVSLRYGPEPPGLLAKTVGMMGLRKVPGLNVIKALPEREGLGSGRGQAVKRERDMDGLGDVPMQRPGAAGGQGMNRGGAMGGGARGGGSGKGGVGRGSGFGRGRGRGQLA